MTEKNKYTLALILSALIFPGAGQIYLKQRVKGVIYCGATLLILMLLILGFTLEFYHQLLTLPETGYNLVQNVMALSQTWSAMRGSLLWGLIAIVIIWLACIIDILRSRSKTD